jgi:ferritin-like metal-binding protein YciE
LAAAEFSGRKKKLKYNAPEREPDGFSIDWLCIRPQTNARRNSMPITTLHDLFQDELADIMSAEIQLSEALPKMANEAHNDELSEGFRTHLSETEGQIERLQQVVEICNLELPQEVCEAMKGLVREAEEMIEQIEDREVLDAALITAAQKVEHYEIASYGSLCALARCLGLEQEAISLLEKTLQEEKETDEKLSALAEKGGINQQALDKAA